MIYGECSCPWGWDSRAEEARLRAVPYFSFEPRRSRARHSACEGRGTMAEAQVKKKISSLQPHLSSFLPLICTLSLFRSLRLAGKRDDRSRAVKKKADKITSIPPTRAICTPVHRLEINQEIDDRPRLSHEKRLVEECEIQGNKQQQKTQLCAPR